MIPDAPVAVELTLTEACNHRCIHCFNPNRTVLIKQKKYVRNVDFILNEIIEKNVLKVVVSGGEPLTNPDETFHVIKRLEENDIVVSLNTNLTLINDEFISKLKQLAYVPPLFVSLPSFESKTCDQITSIDGSYRRIMKALDLCDNQNIEVALNTVISKVTNYSIESIKKLIKSHKCIKHIALSPVTPPTYDPNNPIFILDPEDVRNISKTLTTLSKEMNISVGSSMPLPLCIVEQNHDFIKNMSMCCAGRTYCTINCDTGNVTACSHENCTYGNVYDEDLSEIWSKMGIWRDDELLNQSCKTCGALSQCSGICRMLNNEKITNAIHPIEHIEYSASESTNLDLNQRYYLNPELRFRKEKFGCTILLGNMFTMAKRGTYELLELLSSMNTFDLSNLENKVLINDDFKNVFSELLNSNVILVEGN